MRRHVFRSLSRQEGNALWVSTILVITVGWVGFISLKISTNELELAGNVRERAMLRQAGSGITDRMVGLCDVNAGDFAAKATEAARLKQTVIECKTTPSPGVCTLAPGFANSAFFNKFVGTFSDWWADPDGRGKYEYKVRLVPGGGGQVLKSSTCYQKFDVYTEVSTPGAPSVYTTRTTITAQPVTCENLGEGVSGSQGASTSHAKD